MSGITLLRAFLRALTWNALTGVTTLFAGMLIPRRLNAEAFPFRAYAFEAEGRVYRRLGVHKWKNRLPDASRVIRSMTRKALTGEARPEPLEKLVQETCVAEATHWLLIALSTVSLLFTPVGAGCAFCAIYALGNLPFIIIQRYNRPRLQNAIRLMRRRENAGKP